MAKVHTADGFRRILDTQLPQLPDDLRDPIAQGAAVSVSLYSMVLLTCIIPSLPVRIVHSAMTCCAQHRRHLARSASPALWAT